MTCHGYESMSVTHTLLSLYAVQDKKRRMKIKRKTVVDTPDLPYIPDFSPIMTSTQKPPLPCPTASVVSRPDGDKEVAVESTSAMVRSACANVVVEHERDGQSATASTSTAQPSTSAPEVPQTNASTESVVIIEDVIAKAESNTVQEKGNRITA